MKLIIKIFDSSCDSSKLTGLRTLTKTGRFPLGGRAHAMEKEWKSYR